jgi:hypothetical protein
MALPAAEVLGEKNFKATLTFQIFKQRIISTSYAFTTISDFRA